MSLVEHILAHAARDPSRLAVVFDGHEIDYGRFAGFITATGGFLSRQGLPAGGVAVVCAQSLFDACVLGLALRACGLTTLVVREEAEAEGLSGLDIACVVTLAAEPRAGLVAHAERAGWRSIRVSGGLEPADFTPSRTPGGHILATSGATGAPKLVLATPAMEDRNWLDRRRLWDIGPASVVNLMDFGGWTAVGHNAPGAVWSAGGAAVIATHEHRWRSMARRDLTHAVMTPLFLSHLVDHLPPGFVRNPALTLISTGGALAPAVIAAARERITDRLFDGLSATEAGLIAYTPLDTPDDFVWKRIVPGRAVRVADDAGAEVALGQVGRLGVRIEDGLSGYLGDRAASDGQFQDGYFYSGDLAVMRADGRISLQGRASDVLNIGGAKRPAGPLEEAIRVDLGVSAICLMQSQAEGGDLRLHVVIESEQQVASNRLADAVSSRLPELDSVQAHVLASLPRNHMGKIDRPEVRRRLGLSI